MEEVYPLRYTPTGLIFISPKDNCGKVVDAMLATDYMEEFCIALDWTPPFIARLMKAGFLVMSETLTIVDRNPVSCDLVLPKLHLVRSVLFFNNLHVKQSIKPYLPRYELRFDTEFETVVNNCLTIHGTGWLTPSLVEILFTIRKNADAESAPKNNPFPALVPTPYPRPVSFGLYRNGALKAGEFGVMCGRVYTSYSGYKTEDNAGTVQMILMARALKEAGFDFLDFGMPLGYKTDLGSLDISPKRFVSIFRAAQF